MQIRESVKKLNSRTERHRGETDKTEAQNMKLEADSGGSQ